MVEVIDCESGFIFIGCFGGYVDILVVCVVD